MEKIINTETMQKIGAKFLDYKFPFPGCRDHKVGTDAYWTCLAHQGGWAFQHAISSCRMGARDDPQAVVDPQLR
jgi:choline dehydrogenase